MLATRAAATVQVQRVMTQGSLRPQLVQEARQLAAGRAAGAAGRRTALSTRQAQVVDLVKGLATRSGFNAGGGRLCGPFW